MVPLSTVGAARLWEPLGNVSCRADHVPRHVARHEHGVAAEKSPGGDGFNDSCFGCLVVVGMNSRFLFFGFCSFFGGPQESSPLFCKPIPFGLERFLVVFGWFVVGLRFSPPVNPTI